MLAIGSLLVLLALSLIVTRVATLVLVATGMSQTAARFQARSAFTGAGFTTSESEQVTENPVRRKVVMYLMLLGHIGIVAGASTVILGFEHGNAAHLGLTGVELVVGLFVLLVASKSAWVDRHLTVLIWRLLRRFSRFTRTSVDTLVELADHFAVCELHVRPGQWLEGRPVSDLRSEGITVLGLTSNDGYEAAPSGTTLANVGTTMVVHGPLELLDEIDHRITGESGDAEHARRIASRRQPPGSRDDSGQAA